MRSGLFPGQLDELKRLARVGMEAERRTRRQFVAASAAVVMAGVGGFLLGRWSGPADSPANAEPQHPIERVEIAERWRRRIPWAEAFASGPLQELIDGRSTFLTVLEATGGTPAMWDGYRRLAEWAIENHAQNPEARRVVDRLAATVDVLTLPSELWPIPDRLRQITRVR